MDSLGEIVATPSSQRLNTTLQSEMGLFRPLLKIQFCHPSRLPSLKGLPSVSSRNVLRQVKASPTILLESTYRPDDYVVGKCGVGKSNCFVIHSETTIFVLSSAQGTALAYRSTLRQFFQNATFVPDNGTIVKMTGFRFAKADSIRPSEPTSSPTFILEDVQQNEGNIFDKMRALPQDNPLAFWIIIGVVVIVLVGSGLCLIKGCCSRKG